MSDSTHGHSVPKQTGTSHLANPYFVIETPDHSSSNEVFNVKPASPNGNIIVKKGRVIDSITISLFLIASLEETFVDTFGEMVCIDSSYEKPLVVLDCANIGWTYGIDFFCAKGVDIAISYFVENGANVIGFLPAYYLYKKPSDGCKQNSVMQTDDWELLDNHRRFGTIVLVPPGDNDDLYILTHARIQNGFVISNDHFQDHIKSLESNDIRLSTEIWIHEHRISYTFINKKFMINPVR